MARISWANNTSGDWATAANWSGGALPNSSSNVVIATTTVQTITHNSGNDVINLLQVGNDHFDLNGGSLEILTTASFADGYTQNGGSLLAGDVTIKRGAILDGGSATGSTVLNVTGTTAIANYTLGGSATLKNTSFASQTGAITLGDATGVDATISNAAGARYSIAGDYGINGGAASAAVVNAGIFGKSNGSGTSTVGADILSTGTITAAAGGTLEFTGPNDTISGAITGAGAVEFGGSSDTTLTIGTITNGGLAIVDGATLALGTTTVLHGALTEAANFGNTTLDLGANTLTVAGKFAFGGFEGTSHVVGTGGLVLAGTSTLGGGVLGGSITATNEGALTQTGAITLGDGSGGLVQFVNAHGATYDFTQATAIGLGANTGSAFTNDGTLETTAAGTSTINAALTNAGTAAITVASGSLLDLGNTLSSTGTIAGAGDLQLINAADATLGAGTALTVAELDVIDGATLTLGTSLSYAGKFVEAASFGQALISLGANTLTLTGTSNAISGFEGEANVSGSGRLTNAGTLAVGQLTLGGAVTLDNTGLVNQTGSVVIGDGSGQAATIVNTAGATWNLTNANGIADGTNTNSAFQNFGTIDATPGAGATTTIATTLDNEHGGTIKVGNGALLVAGSFTNSGAIVGGDLQLVNGGVTTLLGGDSLSMSELDLLNASTLVLGANQSFAGTFADNASFGSGTVDLAGHTLTLSGPAAFTGFEGNAVINGGGTLSVSGATTIAGLVIGNTSTLSNTGSVSATGGLTTGDGSGLAATFSNAAGGIYDLLNDSGIGVGSSMASSFINAGLFEKTSGTGTSVVSDHFVNNGTITVTSGTVEFVAGSLVNNGTINGVVSTDQQGNVFITHS